MERKPEEIVSDIDATRTRLVTNLGELTERLQPEQIMRRQLQRVRGFYVDEATGGVRQDRAVQTGGVVAGLLLLRKIFR